MVRHADSFWPELEKLGEAKVRESLANKLYSHKDVGLVEEWLRREEQKKQVGIFKAEQSLRERELNVATSSKNAAWFAAIMAGLSILISIAALVVSLKH